MHGWFSKIWLFPRVQHVWTLNEITAFIPVQMMVRNESVPASSFLLQQQICVKAIEQSGVFVDFAPKIEADINRQGYFFRFQWIMLDLVAVNQMLDASRTSRFDCLCKRKPSPTARGSFQWFWTVEYAKMELENEGRDSFSCIEWLSTASRNI